MDIDRNGRPIPQIEPADVAHVATVAIHAVAGVKDSEIEAIRARAETAEAKLQEIGAVVEHEHYNNFAAMVQAYREERSRAEKAERDAATWRTECESISAREKLGPHDLLARGGEWLGVAMAYGHEIERVRSELQRAQGVVSKVREFFAAAASLSDTSVPFVRAENALRAALAEYDAKGGERG